jgi:hypothetical protein
MTWALVALVLLGPAREPVWQVVGRYEFRGQCEEASLRHVGIATCVWSPNSVL